MSTKEQERQAAEFMDALRSVLEQVQANKDAEALVAWAVKLPAKQFAATLSALTIVGEQWLPVFEVANELHKDQAGIQAALVGREAEVDAREAADKAAEGGQP